MTSQNWSGWCRTHWFLVGVDKDNVLLEVSGRQPHCTHHHCQLRNHMMSHDMIASHHQPIDHPDYITRIYTSLVPRPHSLMRRNGLVNQVELLGLAHTFATFKKGTDMYCSLTQICIAHIITIVLIIIGL